MAARCGGWIAALLPAARANLDLEALVAESLANNPAVQAAQYEVSRAKAERDEFRSFFDPQLNAAASQAAYNAGYNQAFLHAGVDAAILPGVYLGARFLRYAHLVGGIRGVATLVCRGEGARGSWGL